MKKYSILTFIFDDYENVREPLEVSPDCEYVLVTDNKNIKSDVWNIKYIPNLYSAASGITKSFYVRYHPFEFVSTNVCILLDGSIMIKKSLDKLFNDFMAADAECSLMINWYNQNAYADYQHWLKNRNYDKKQCEKNKAFLRATGLTEQYKGWFECGFRIIKNTANNNEINRITWEALNKISDDKLNLDRLDQTIWSAIINVMFDNIAVFPVTRQIIQNDYLQLCEHKSNTPMIRRINFDNLWLFNKKIKVYKLGQV
jgi:hypothetical protein